MIMPEKFTTTTELENIIIALCFSQFETAGKIEKTFVIYALSNVISRITSKELMGTLEVKNGDQTIVAESKT